MEMSQSDPVTEWSSSGGQIGLEEPMWQLGLGGGSESYPERPDEADCIYYLRTGFCGYGSRCRFNHPRDRGSVVGALRAGGGEYPERIGQPVCQYYMRMGMCKFGASCKYHHPRHGVGSSSTVALNVSGYPLRPSEKECSYYVKTGQCKFGITCKFHHPQLAGMMPSPPPPLSPGPLSAMPSAMYPNVQSPTVASSQQYGFLAGNWPVGRPPLLPGSYLPGTYGPMLVPPGMLPFPGWNPYQGPVHPAASPNSQPIVGVGPGYAVNQLSPSYPLSKSQNFPERPGEPECQFYMKTGDCKFGSSCKYHHPPEWSVSKTNFVLSPMGLPLRPGAPLCSHYAQNGVCKFGPSCKFDHPMGTLSYSPSASSLADMPVAPYPVGSYIGTLAPSSSSSELRPEVTSGSTTMDDGISTSMPSGSKSMQLSQSTGSSSTTHNT
ncbi:zinc finger CCCH domain-containing protein 34-like [Cynara cardunculus var. scolymus]|uniref:zinc finger CCCH domain-containing protein 34-like n=1 Tax=Cynara cardunculus var. scolymus TaxID=59895 RepID=UPI000D623FEC|nr:zinc finger CCCH domain-containing protein 34-like [Cynara cardunculus var. scolymus]